MKRYKYAIITVNPEGDIDVIARYTNKKAAARMLKVLEQIIKRNPEKNLRAHMLNLI